MASLDPNSASQERLLRGFHRSTSMPSFNLNSTSQEKILREFLEARTASQERHVIVHAEDDNCSKSEDSASFLQRSINDDLCRRELTSLCSPTAYGHCSDNANLPSRKLDLPSDFRSLSRLSRDQGTVSVCGLHTDNTSDTQAFEDNEANNLVFEDGRKCLQNFRHNIPAPPGFGRVRINGDVSSQPAYRLSVNKNSDLTTLRSIPLSVERSISQQSLVGNRAQSMLRDDSTGLTRAGVSSMPRVRSMDFIGRNQGSLPTISSNVISGVEAATMRRSPSSSKFADDSIPKRSPSIENFGGLSAAGHSEMGSSEQLMTIPEATCGLQDIATIGLKQQKPQTLDENIPRVSLCNAREPAVYQKGLPSLDINISHGHSIQSHSTAELFAQVQQKRLELFKLEDNILRQLIELNLYDEQLRASSNHTMSLPADIHQHASHGTVCRYHALGNCIKGNTCPFLHPHKAAEAAPPLIEKPALSTLNSQTSNVMLCHGRETIHNDENIFHLGCDYATQVASPKTFCKIPLRTAQCTVATSSLPNMDCRQGIVMSLDDVEGCVCLAAKDPQLSRFLQAKLAEGKPEDVKRIFQEVIKGDLFELVMDPYANFLIKSLIEICSSAQYKIILEALVKRGNLVTLLQNAHGTRVIQKAIERLEEHNQRLFVILSLRNDVVRLIKDPCANHVIQKCVQHFGYEDSQFVYDAAILHCEEIASDRHGCLVLQRCLDFASSPQRKHLVDVITANAVSLSQNPYGNYVVQYILELNLPWASKGVILKLKGKFAELAMQKCGSNVVEKCLRVADEEDQECIVRELMETSVFSQLLHHPYANYVIQSALGVTKGSLHSSLVQAILPCITELRNSPYGKRILFCSHLRT